MKIVNYSNKYAESVKDLFVELQQYLTNIDDENILLLKEKYREDYFNFAFKLIKTNNGILFLATEDNKVIGLVTGYLGQIDEEDVITNCCPKRGIVSDLIVSKSCRGGGVGKKLMEKMEEYFKKCKCDHVAIEVFGPNKSALEFYERLGYNIRSYTVGKKISK